MEASRAGLSWLCGLPPLYTQLEKAAILFSELSITLEERERREGEGEGKGEVIVQPWTAELPCHTRCTSVPVAWCTQSSL